MVWKPIEDSKVRHRWVHPHDEGDDECPGDKEVHVNPSFYADAGTPICGECGVDFLYAGTEVDLPESGQSCSDCGKPILGEPHYHGIHKECFDKRK